jgi:NAD(P)-dependent dehydrogenase (short-subunit alcohol dehydrogenase family)
MAADTLTSPRSETRERQSAAEVCKRAAVEFPVPAVASLLDFRGKVALVTGASGGIGAGIAARLAEAGATVVVHYRSDGAGAAALAAKIGGLAVPAELTDTAAVEALVAAAVDHAGRLDVVVNNAALQPVAALADLDPDSFDTVVDANLGGAFRVLRATAARWRQRGEAGAVVNIVSIEAIQPAAGHAHYSASKAALMMLTRSAALEYGPSGIRVNAVAPGLIWREGIEAGWPEGVARWRAAAPLGRLGHPSDVADACLFLASPAARWITGHTLVVDGGVLTAGTW